MSQQNIHLIRDGDGNVVSAHNVDAAGELRKSGPGGRTVATAPVNFIHLKRAAAELDERTERFSRRGR